VTSELQSADYPRHPTTPLPHHPTSFPWTDESAD
jgi:hypothetical protein